MVDIHIIDSGHPNYPAQLAALQHPLVNIHEPEYVPGSIVAARARAYALGTAPYVSWVDDDDAILDLSWLEEAVSWLDTDPTIAAVYPRWRLSINGVIRHETSGEPFNPMRLRQSPDTPAAHHLTIMRRANVLPMVEAIHAAQPTMTRLQDVLLTIGQLRHGRLVPHPALAYEWRAREGSGRTLHDPSTAWALTHLQESLRCV